MGFFESVHATYGSVKSSITGTSSTPSKKLGFFKKLFEII